MKATNTLKKDPYENCIVRSKDGEVIFYCSSKRIRWYLDRNLATFLNDSPLEIQLTFEAKGRGFAGDEFYIQARDNHCVVCSEKQNLTRHHIVPISFRRYLPDSIKDNSYHDVVPLCISCHSKYEEYSYELRRELEAKYNAPHQGIFCNKEEVGLLNKCKSDAITLLKYSEKIPQERKDELIQRIKDALGVVSVNLEDVAQMDVGAKTITQGEMVVKRLTSGEEGAIFEFVKMWREHFICKMSPKFLPMNWRVDRPIEKR